MDKLLKHIIESTNKAADIQNLIDIQVNDPIIKTEPYFAGLANGLIVAKACVDGSDVEDQLVDCPPKVKENELLETPWVEVGTKVIDLELEKQPRDKNLVVDHIKELLNKLGANGRKTFITNLFQGFPVIMNSFGIRQEDLI